MFTVALRAFVFIALCPARASLAQYLSATDYSYLPTALYNSQNRDPSSWASIAVSSSDPTPLYPLCENKVSQQQSPIAIKTTVVDKQLKAFTALTDAYPLDGITSASWWFNGADLRLKSFDTDSIFVDPEEFQINKVLEYISFHIGSNHAIGGSRADLEISMVFAPAPGFTSYSDTLTIVSVLATTGALSSHRLLSQLLESLPFSWGVGGGANGRTGGSNGAIPSASGKSASIPYVKGKYIDYRQFMPGRRTYFTYIGSEPAPPCRKARWYVMEAPIHISRQQLALLRNRTGASGVSPNSAMANELVGNHRPLQSVVDTSASGLVVRQFEEIFVETKFDNIPPTYQGRRDIVAMAVMTMIIGVGAAASAAFVIYKNWLELMKLPTNYGVDKSLMETIHADVAMHNNNNKTDASGKGRKNSNSTGAVANRRKGDGGGRKEEKGKYLKGLPAATKQPLHHNNNELNVSGGMSPIGGGHGYD